MLAVTFAGVLYLPAGSAPPYVLGLLMGIGSGAAMIPYTVIKEVNPDEIKGSATGAINCLVFSMTALINPWFGRMLAGMTPAGQPIGLAQFQQAGSVLLGGVVLAIVLTFLLRETGFAAQRPAPR